MMAFRFPRLPYYANYRYRSAFLITSLVLTLIGCGGGGGGNDSFVGAAIATVDVSPNRIDTGDRTLVTIFAQSIHRDGILVKLRMPSGLEYVPGRGKLKVGRNEFNFSPAVNRLDQDERLYLVYFVSPSMLGSEENFELRLELEGKARVINGRIEVDADVNDLTIPDEQEFDISNPEFTAEDWAPVVVRDF